MNAAVFLDRDNTLIHNDGDLGNPAEVRLIQGAASAIASLRGLNFRIVVVTNQGGVARGKYTEKDVDAVNARINDLVKANTGALIDRFYYCPFHPEATVEKYRGEHPWRKPNPGMLLQAAEDLGLDLSQCWMVGDQRRDVEAGERAGVRSILLTDKAEELSPLRLEQLAAAQATGDRDAYFSARNLVEAVRIIAQQRKPEMPEGARRDRVVRRWEGATRPPNGRGAEPAPPPEPPREPGRANPVATPTMAPPVVTAPGPEARRAAPPVAAPTPVPAAPPAASRPEPRPEPAPVTVAAPAPTLRTPAADAEPPANGDAHHHADADAVAEPARRVIRDDDLAREDETLRQILQELRSQRAIHGEFSYLKVLAIIVQMVALVCLIGALWLGHENPGAFVHWIATAIFLQLSTLAILLFEK